MSERERENKYSRYERAAGRLQSQKRNILECIYEQVGIQELTHSQTFRHSHTVRQRVRDHEPLSPEWDVPVKSLPRDSGNTTEEETQRELKNQRGQRTPRT